VTDDSKYLTDTHYGLWEDAILTACIHSQSL